MFLITLISERVNERTITSMVEDIWCLPFIVALYLLPDKPNQWVYFVRALKNSDLISANFEVIG
jgi:hypothetical protein